MAVQGLPDAARRIVYALYDCAQPPSKDKPAGPPEEKGMTEEKERLLGIARNAFPLGYEAQIYGLFPVAARLNHSCRPNVHHSFDEVKDRLVVYAVTQIKKDQELFTSYYDLCLPRAARQKYLSDVYTFVCKCPACSLKGAELEASDKRRGSIKTLDEDVLTNFQLGKYKQGIMKVELKLKALQAENIEDTAYVAKTSYDALQGALIAKKLKDAKAWAKKAYHARATSDGPDCSSAKNMAIYMEDPRKHRLWSS
eukprot:g3763.t1